MDAAIERAFKGRPPSGKLKVVLQGEQLELYHYHHLLLRYDTSTNQPTLTWHEKPTDKRILNAALESLADRQQGSSQPATKRKRPLEPQTPPGGQIVSQKQLCVQGGYLNVAEGDDVTEKASVFRAAVAYPVKTRAQASAAVAALAGLSSLQGADHKIWCFRAMDGSEQADDDGEARAGASLRAALRKQKVSGCAVVVARWYGGVNIGKARFQIIQERAVSLLRLLGHTEGMTMEQLKWAKAGQGRRLGGELQSGGRDGRLGDKSSEQCPVSSEQQVQGQDVVPQAAQWSCPQCTLVNSGAQCEVCDAPRESASLRTTICTRPNNQTTSIGNDNTNAVPHAKLEPPNAQQFVVNQNVVIISSDDE